MPGIRETQEIPRAVQDNVAATLSRLEATDGSSYSEVRQTGNALQIDLANQSSGGLDVSGSTVTVQEDNPLDVSGATVNVQEASPLDVSGATVSIQEDTALDVSASEVRTAQQTPQITDTNDSPSSGSGSAVSLDLGAARKYVDIFYDVSTTDDNILIEVSTTGNFSGEERQHTSASANTGGDMIQIDTTYQYVRVYAGSSFTDADVNTLEIVSRGN